MTKPLPVVDAGTRPFWDACAEQRLVVQRCSDCLTWRWPPRGVCANCHSWNTTWEPLAGDGVVESHAVVHRAFDEAFAGDVPYVVALVALAGTDGQASMLTNVVECETADVRIGMPVHVVFDDVADGIALPKFAPVAGSAR